MAYIDKETVKEIRTKINETFRKDGFKFSVRREHYSTVEISLMESPLSLHKAYDQLNPYYLDNLENDNVKVIFKLIDTIVDKITGGQVDRNAGDMGADYSDCNFYKSYNIGKWNKECKAEIV